MHVQRRVFVSAVAFYFAFLVVFCYCFGHGRQSTTPLGIKVRPQTLCCSC